MITMNITDADQAIRLGLVDKKLLKKYGKDVLQKWIDQVNEGDPYEYSTFDENSNEINLNSYDDEFENIVLRGDRYDSGL